MRISYRQQRGATLIVVLILLLINGTNHTLPTYGYARMYSGVSVDTFLKKITFQGFIYFLFFIVCF